MPSWQSCGKFWKIPLSFHSITDKSHNSGAGSPVLFVASPASSRAETMEMDTVVAGPASGPVPGTRLGTKEDVARMCAMAWRTVLRNADRGAMPSGYKIGALRRWDLDEVAAWIAGGCKPVRTVKRKGGTK